MKHLLNQTIMIRSNRTGARYWGKLVGFREQGARFCLSGLAILNRDGYVIAAPKWNNRRWFKTENFSVVPAVFTE
jgi:hypothetical protein